MQLIERKPSVKVLFKRLLIAFGVDIVLFVVFIIWLNPEPDDPDVEIFLLWGVFITNICLAVVSRYTIRKLYIVFVLNSIFATLIFHFMLNAWIAYK